MAKAEMINLQQHVRMSIPLKTQNIAGSFKVNNKKPISKQQKKTISLLK